MPPASPSRRSVLTGRILSGLAVAFLAFDVGGKLFVPEPVREGMTAVGWPVHLAPVLGVILLVCLVLYVVPATSRLGAVLLTGYLGGAVATNLRIESPLLTHVLFPVYVAILLWGGLALRDPAVRDLLLPRRRGAA